MTLNELYKQADYKDKTGMMFNADCLDVMAKMDDSCVDLVVTDPPYLMNYVSHRRKELFSPIQSDNLGGQELISKYLFECYRILKDNTAIYCFCSWHNVDFFKQEFEKYFKLKNILIWNKNNHGSGDLKGAYAPKYEMVLYGHKGRSLLREKRIPDVIDCAKVSGSVSNHPTEKPIELLKIFIGNNSDEGQIVFDGFAGVSSTCMAAKELNRKFIGIELDKGYFDVAVERISGVIF